jgi:glutamate/tyrosine decarboxylase-like PLP-dependent enzyme
VTVPHPLFLADVERHEAFHDAIATIDRYLTNVESLPVERAIDASEVARFIERINFAVPMKPDEAIAYVNEAMLRFQTHTGHPGYFGLFNPASTAMGIVGEAMVAAFNPQLAAWSHAPFAVQLEQFLIRSMGRRFGEEFSYGAFTSGGAEANFTATLSALAKRFPTFSSAGARSLPGQPIAYASAAAHHSMIKVVRALGLGTEALRIVPCDTSYRMDVDALRDAIESDRRAGSYPFFVVGTAGATATGIIEPLAAISDVATDNGLWFHVDAAWGGFAAFVPEFRSLLAGAEFADSVTFDPHKMLGIPMGAGMFLTRHGSILGEVFSVTTSYMPASTSDDQLDPFTHSMQWSRRFIGLKLFLSLAVAGWDGYAEVLRDQVRLGNLLRKQLVASNWKLHNRTPLPIVCTTPMLTSKAPAKISEDVKRRGRSWVSSVILPDGTPTIRACICNYRTSAADIERLIVDLTDAASESVSQA